MSDSVKNLGVTFHCHLTMKTHVSNLVRPANFELRRISSIRHLLSTEATKTLVSAFVLSRLGYCNSSFWLYSASPKQTTEGSEQRCSPCSESLKRTTFLLILLLFIVCPLIHGYSTNSSPCYNCLNSTAPDYLTELLRINKPTRQLRSSSDISILCIPTVGTHSLGQRSFSIFLCCADSLRHSPLRNQVIKHHLFKSSLKKYLFQPS